MELFLFNVGWMLSNILLALIPIFLARAVFTQPQRKKSAGSTFLKFIGAIVWFFFLPNTIYLVTDIVNLLYDVQYIQGILLLLDAAMYISLIPLGVITFIWAVSPFEKMYHAQIPLFVLNFFVAFGVVLGRVQRANSWEVITDPQSVVARSIEIVRSPDLLILVFVFAIFSQVVYIRFKKIRR